MSQARSNFHIADGDSFRSTIKFSEMESYPKIVCCLKRPRNRLTGTLPTNVCDASRCYVDRSTMLKRKIICDDTKDFQSDTSFGDIIENEIC